MNYGRYQQSSILCVCLGMFLGLTACSTAPSAESPKPQAAAPAGSDLRAVIPPAFHPDRKKTIDPNAVPLFETAMQSYSRKDYGKASVTLREVTLKSPESPEARFFLGICYLMTNDTEAAISELKTAAALGDSEYREDAHFFLGQAYARKRDSINATRELDQVIEINGTQAAKARTLREIVNVSIR